MTDPEMDRLRRIAREAASRGGEVVSGAGGGRRSGVTAKSLPGDWVTEVDVASERAIVAFLGGETPDIPVQGEEGGGMSSGLRWVIDPLDGTTNFIHGFVAVGVSVALVDHREVKVGAIQAPFLGEAWHGAAGAGAVWERADGSATACRVSGRPWSEAVVGTGFPFRRKERLGRYLPAMTSILEGAEDLRRPGAACLDLAWVASGVFDGFFELGLSAWDVAAGGLLIREAGGIVTDWLGNDAWLDGDVVAGSPAVWERMVAVTAEAGSGGDLRDGPTGAA